MKKNILSGDRPPAARLEQLSAGADVFSGLHFDTHICIRLISVSLRKGVGCAKMYTVAAVGFFCVCVGAPQPAIITVSIEGGQITAYKMY